ncbi:MAG: ATP-binding protein [Gammaproteobacteria bacterium]
MQKPNYTSRIAEKTIKRYLSAFPVLGVSGPRQSGKSTLLQHMLPDYRYVTFDDLRNVDYFHDDPVGFMKEYHDRVIFDEVQFVPEIFHHIKIAVDNDRKCYGKFVLTGSSQFAYLQKASESLAGRMGLFNLLPYQYSELPSSCVKDSIFKGSYPELVNRDYYESDLWYASYIDTYIQKDVRALANIGDLRDFRKLIHLLAANVAKLLDYTEHARAIGVSVPTIKRWISILEASFIIFLLPAYHNNFGKRIIKSPKIYFHDTGLVSFLTGIHSFEQYDKGPMAGSIFENYVISEVLKKEKHLATMSELYFLRTSAKKEIDLIIDRKNHKEMIEIKKSKTFKSSFVATVKEFLGKNDVGYLLYGGEKYPYQDNIKVLCYSDYLNDV